MPINPRPTFRRSIEMLKQAVCPECGRKFDEGMASEEYAPRIKPLNCSWCSERWRMIREFSAWARQERNPH